MDGVHHQYTVSNPNPPSAHKLFSVFKDYDHEASPDSEHALNQRCHAHERKEPLQTYPSSNRLSRGLAFSLRTQMTDKISVQAFSMLTFACISKGLDLLQHGMCVIALLSWAPIPYVVMYTMNAVHAHPQTGDLPCEESNSAKTAAANT